MDMNCVLVHSPYPIPYSPPWQFDTPPCLNSAMSALPRAALGEWVLVTAGMAGSVRSLMVPLRNPVFKRCSLMLPAATFV